MTTLRKWAGGLALALAMGSAHAVIAELQVSGSLDYGTDKTNVFGLGLNTDLAGQSAIFKWTLELAQLGADKDPATDAVRYDCGLGAGSCTYFMSASVTINGVTRSLGGTSTDYTNELRMTSDTDGAGLTSEDSYYLRMGQTRSTAFGGWYQDATGAWFQVNNNITSKIEISVADKVDAILASLNPSELDQWSTQLLTGVNDSGSIVFAFNEQTPFFQTTIFATGGMTVTGAQVTWGSTTTNPGGGTTPPDAGNTVPEPGTMALLALGGVALIVRRSNRGVRPQPERQPAVG